MAEQRQNISHTTGLKNELLAILRDGEFQKTIKPFIKNRRVYYIIHMVLFIVICFLLGLFFNEISIQMRESALQRLKFSLDQKIQTFFIVEEAIINTRSIREMSIISCGTKLESERLTARLRLEAAADITDLDFPKEVSNSLYKAVARDAMVKDVCSLSVEGRLLFSSELTKIEELMRETINNDKLRIAKIVEN